MTTRGPDMSPELKLLVSHSFLSQRNAAPSLGPSGGSPQQFPHMLPVDVRSSFGRAVAGTFTSDDIIATSGEICTASTQSKPPPGTPQTGTVAERASAPVVTQFCAGPILHKYTERLCSRDFVPPERNACSASAGESKAKSMCALGGCKALYSGRHAR
eukprot:gene2625-biopygen18572